MTVRRADSAGSSGFGSAAQRASADTEAPLLAQGAQEATVPIERLDARHSDAAAATLGEAIFDDALLLIAAAAERRE